MKINPADLGLSTSLAQVRGVRMDVARALANLGVPTVGHLVAHLPARHEQLEAEAPIAELAPDQLAAARGVVSATRIVRTGRRPRFEAVLVDDEAPGAPPGQRRATGPGRLDLVWFNALYLRDRIHPGTRLLVQGKTRRFGPGLQMANPRVVMIAPPPGLAGAHATNAASGAAAQAGEADASADHPARGADGGDPAPREARLRPVYPAGEGVSSAQIEQVMGVVLEPALTHVHDHLDEAFRVSRALPTLAQAYRSLHAPKTPAEIADARRRLAYDELLMMQLALALKRHERRRATRAHALPADEAIDRHIRARLPFALTPAQERVIAQLRDDLALATPANRLIQGDVGSGKTVVALYAMLLAVARGRQAALMAPTELLAEQHHATFARLLEGAEVAPALLTGRLAARPRRALLDALADGSQRLVIGTHALLGERVAFQSLAVVVIDEQHRFGVHQRAVLREKGISGVEALPPAAGGAGGGPAATPLFQPAPEPMPRAGFTPDPARGADAADARALAPHVLVMTATPIPRTLALTLLGDLDVSTIDQLPPGRTPVRTRLVDATRSGEVYAWLRTRLERGEQAYIVAPSIDDRAMDLPEHPEGGAPAAPPGEGVVALHARLSGAGGPLAGLSLGLLHGQLSPEQREAVMARFRAGTLHALVATTVIEVGVDVPNASVIVIEQAERFGLAQLHQLRGRVGRGPRASACILITGAPGPAATTNAGASIDAARARLDALVATTDGFALAERDLALRGFGEVAGVRQAGAPPFRVAELPRDLDLLALVRRDARAWIDRSPELSLPEESLLRRRMLRAHGGWLGLAGSV